jgi:hypothetical protein
VTGWPWRVATIATLIGAAVVPRAMMDLDPPRFYMWMALASALFLSGMLVWALFLIPDAGAQIRPHGRDCSQNRHHGQEHLRKDLGRPPGSRRAVKTRSLYRRHFVHEVTSPQAFED